MSLRRLAEFQKDKIGINYKLSELYKITHKNFCK